MPKDGIIISSEKIKMKCKTVDCLYAAVDRYIKLTAAEALPKAKP